MSLDRLLRVPLAPLLVAQGLWLRAVTPQLPEALGPHSGIAGHGPALRVLFVGDSSVAGVGVDHLERALPGRVVQTLAARHEIHWHVHARSGATTSTTLRTLPPHPCDIAIVGLGVNDATGFISVPRWVQQTEALIDRLLGCGAHTVHLSAVPPMHRFPVLPQPLRWTLAQQAHRMNRALQVLVDRRARVHLHRLPDQALYPGAMAADGFHPGPDTYRVWADIISAALLRTPDNRRGD